tara:strand:+ start:2176 stop:2955 length:780 start_codon:yes stop_codon:yes gene_type:complete
MKEKPLKNSIKIHSKEKLVKNFDKSLIVYHAQDIFLKLLFLFSQKKYKKNKEFVKNLVQKTKNITKFLFINIYLRLKYPKYLGLPTRHLNTFIKFLNFNKILKKNKINCFLLGGTLLGAVRQESFAGRPTDVDIGIKNFDERKLKNCIKEIIKKGGEKIRYIYFKDKSKKIQITFNSILIDIAIIKRHRFGRKLIWVGDSKKKKYKLIKFDKSSLNKFDTVKLYGKSFSSPTKPENYLAKRYGKNWTIPDKKQYCWKKI